MRVKRTSTQRAIINSAIEGSLITLSAVSLGVIVALMTVDLVHGLDEGRFNNVAIAVVSYLLLLGILGGCAFKSAKSFTDGMNKRLRDFQ